MRIACLGGGPADLNFAISMELRVAADLGDGGADVRAPWVSGQAQRARRLAKAAPGA
ncbi:MAG: hypothetical protein ABI810_02055 [Sphingomonas bacterium]